MKDKDKAIDKKSSQAHGLTVEKRKLELESAELRDNIDIKERKISVLQRKVGLHKVILKIHQSMKELCQLTSLYAFLLKSIFR